MAAHRRIVPPEQLYIYPVFCVFYQLRRFGERLPDEEVKARCVQGRLLFGLIPGTSQNWAQRLDIKTGVQQAQLRTVKILKIDGGILIGGWEEHPGRAPTRQTWWCVPGLMDDTTVPE
jgi:hypothetical protein